MIVTLLMMVTWRTKLDAYLLYFKVKHLSMGFTFLMTYLSISFIYILGWTGIRRGNITLGSCLLLVTTTDRNGTDH